MALGRLPATNKVVRAAVGAGQVTRRVGLVVAQAGREASPVVAGVAAERRRTGSRRVPAVPGATGS